MTYNETIIESQLLIEVKLFNNSSLNENSLSVRAGRSAWETSENPRSTRQNEQILETITKCQASGLSPLTVKATHYALTQISKSVDLNKPEDVKQYIATAKNQNTGDSLSNSSKKKLVDRYSLYLHTHGLTWQKPRYKPVDIIPLIPRTDSINKIIASSSKRYATIFTILRETGLEPHELATMHRRQIDTENGVISAEGCKGHAPRTFHLKPPIAQMLRDYMARHPEEHPFPRSRMMTQMWIDYRNNTADKLNQPELKKILLRNLRNYAGAELYRKTDFITVMRFLGHKKTETTMHYLRAIQINEDPEYVTKTATTPQEICALIEDGYTKADEIDGIHIYRKRK